MLKYQQSFKSRLKISFVWWRRLLELLALRIVVDMGINARIIYIFLGMIKDACIVDFVCMILICFPVRRVLNLYLWTYLVRLSTWRTVNLGISTWLDELLLLWYTHVINLTLYLKELLLSLVLIIGGFYTYHWRLIWLFGYWLDHRSIHVITGLFSLFIIALNATYLNLLCLYRQSS